MKILEINLLEYDQIKNIYKIFRKKVDFFIF